MSRLRERQENTLPRCVIRSQVWFEPNFLGICPLLSAMVVVRRVTRLERQRASRAYQARSHDGLVLLLDFLVAWNPNIVP